MWVCVCRCPLSQIAYMWSLCLNHRALVCRNLSSNGHSRWSYTRGQTFDLLGTNCKKALKKTYNTCTCHSRHSLPVSMVIRPHLSSRVEIRNLCQDLIVFYSLLIKPHNMWVLSVLENVTNAHSYTHTCRSGATDMLSYTRPLSYQWALRIVNATLLSPKNSWGARNRAH